MSPLVPRTGIRFPPAFALQGEGFDSAAQSPLGLCFVSPLVPRTGIEPVRLAARDFKSRMSTYFIIGATLQTITCLDRDRSADYSGPQKWSVLSKFGDFLTLKIILMDDLQSPRFCYGDRIAANDGELTPYRVSINDSFLVNC